jgi:hypothetical protein
MVYLFLKEILTILSRYAGSCRFEGQLFLTLFSIIVGGFFFIVVPLDLTFGFSYSLEIVNYNNLYFIVLVTIEILLTCYLLLIFIIGWLNLNSYGDKVYYFRTFYFILIAIVLLFIYIIVFYIEVFYYAPPFSSSDAYESSVIFDTFKLHRLVVITDSHPFYTEIKQFLRPGGVDHGLYSFDILPQNIRYSGECNSYLASDVDALVERLEEERKLRRLEAERDYHIRMIRKIGISLTIGLWALSWVLRNWDNLY